MIVRTPQTNVATMQLGERWNQPAEYTANLAGDESYEVRISVSENPVTPLPILELLAMDEHPDVRYAMAENANIPPHILRLLQHDENPYVSARATRTLERLSELNISQDRCCA